MLVFIALLRAYIELQYITVTLAYLIPEVNAYIVQ